MGTVSADVVHAKGYHRILTTFPFVDGSQLLSQETRLSLELALVVVSPAVGATDRLHPGLTAGWTLAGRHAEFVDVALLAWTALDQFAWIGTCRENMEER